jgi:hypothetical protein
LVGLSTTITSMLGYDCSVHMCKNSINGLRPGTPC